MQCAKKNKQRNLLRVKEFGTLCEGAKSAESSSESVCPTLVPAGLEATVPHSDDRDEDSLPMKAFHQTE
ncbi:unnamed protein product [Tetraodon nigroviridis]|uniref:(spotted green pufferfish) hypothetical protein n=1 Tax=Tetraodon nigroviridis TaxID=99883 RepID=Q4SYL5_TETNG|nr:unnamed protein product [Tetraodon nigroviridis]